MGGKAAQKKGTAHRWSSIEAQAAGRKGGLHPKKKGPAERATFTRYEDPSQSVDAPPAALTGLEPDLLWIFGQGDARCVLCRHIDVNGGRTFSISSSGQRTRAFHFTEGPALEQFQSYLQGYLAEAGWTLLIHTPERRRQPRPN